MGRSKVKRLPRAVREWLDRELVEGGFEGYERLAAELQERGFSVAKSSVHRYGQQLESRLAAIQASTEAARAIAAAAPDDSDERSAAVISMVQSELFDAMVTLREAGELPEGQQGQRMKLLSQVARSIAEVSRASVNQKRWAAEVRRRLEAAAEEVREVGRGAGLSEDTLGRIEQILTGVV